MAHKNYELGIFEIAWTSYFSGNRCGLSAKKIEIHRLNACGGPISLLVGMK